MPLPAFVSGFNKICFLRSRCSMELWCLDDGAGQLGLGWATCLGESMIQLPRVGWGSLRRKRIVAKENGCGQHPTLSLPVKQSDKRHHGRPRMPERPQIGVLLLLIPFDQNWGPLHQLVRHKSILSTNPKLLEPEVLCCVLRVRTFVRLCARGCVGGWVGGYGCDCCEWWLVVGGGWWVGVVVVVGWWWWWW